jgi:hypothetical protein
MKSKNLFLSVFLLAVCLFFSAPNNAQAEVKVYDANGQFLGIFLGYDYPSVYVFVPSLNVQTGISDSSGVIGVSNIAPYLFFESTDCTGTPFARPYATYQLSRVGADNYLGEHIAPTEMQLHSILDGSLGICQQTTAGFHDRVVPAQRVTQLPFTVPVALPLRFEYQPQIPQTASVPMIGTVGLIAVSILFSISAIIKIKRRDKLSMLEAIKRMVILKM